MVLTICTKKFCAPSGPNKFLPENRRIGGAEVEPLFNFKNNVVNEFENYKVEINKISSQTISNTMPKNISLSKPTRISSLIKSNKVNSLAEKQMTKDKLAANTVVKKVSKIYSGSSNLMPPKTAPVNVTRTSPLPSTSSGRRLSAKPSFDMKHSNDQLKGIRSSNSPKITELKERQNLLQKSSYISKEKPIARRPTLEVIKDAIEREKQKANDKNVGTSFYNFVTVPTSDVSTNTNRKKKKIIKKKRLSDGSTGSNKPGGSQNKAGGKIKTKMGKKKGEATLRKRVNLNTTVSVGVQYHIDED